MSLLSLMPILLLMANLPTSFAATFEEMVAKSAEWNSDFSWGACPEATIAKAPAPERLSCANFTIPLDWADEAPGKGSLFLMRVAAEDQATKKGSIFMNEGRQFFQLEKRVMKDSADH
jgi:hypothetical protein